MAKKTEYKGILIDYSRDSLLTDFGISTLKDRYLLKEEVSPQEAFARASVSFSDNLEHAQRLYDYSSSLWFMFSTPILSNAGSKSTMPISCFLSHVPDSRVGLTEHYKEVAFLSSVGGGISGGWSSIRSDGAKTSNGSVSTGIMPFMHVVDSLILAFRQGYTRRGSYASYLDISHPEIEEFIVMRKPTGGDVNRKNLNLHHTTNISDAFMEACEKNLTWDLIDPHTKRVCKTVMARHLWEEILKTRVATGEPLIHFIDTSNRLKSPAHKDLEIKQSNLCLEITEPTNEDRTAVCCLSSVNIDKYDEWENNELFIEDIVRMLDNTLSYFIANAPDELHKAKYAASMERSIGLGAMGFHSYLQQKNVPFDNPIARGINTKIFSHIKHNAEEATLKLAEERGSCPDAQNAGITRRNIYLIAIAPNASSSIICGNTSPSIEPLRANAYVHKTMSGSFLVKNPYLEKRLKSLGKNTKEVWKSIIINKGSIKHLDFLESWDKDVFKTAMEIDQNWLVQHASDRQPYICQAQSLNLFFSPNASVKYLHDVHYKAWKSGIKTLYYCRSESIGSVESISEQIERKEVKAKDTECLGCEG